MPIDSLQHCNIRCAEEDLAALETFYVDVVGLQKGPRPGLRNKGTWLYLGDRPVVHVSVRCAAGFLERDHRGSVDHVAFGARDAAAFRARFDALGIAYEQQNVAGAGYQIFIHDPVGTALEFNFPNSEAPPA